MPTAGESWCSGSVLSTKTSGHDMKEMDFKPRQSSWGAIVDTLIKDDNNNGQGDLKSNDSLFDGPRRTTYNPRKNWPRQHPPIHNICDIPAHLEWNPYDSDIDENDIDANIDRCLDRIYTGIIPIYWQLRLEKYQKLRSERQARQRAAEYMKTTRGNEPAGLKEQAYKRIYELRLLELDLVAKRDPQNQLPNVRALLKAYRSGDLEIQKGQVIFYLDGVPLGEPKEWNVKEYLAIQKEKAPDAVLWVEGIRQTFGVQ